MQILASLEGTEEGGHAFVEPIVILLILVLNAVVGVWQEHNAENALEALKELQSCATRCIRDGVLIHNMPSAHLVPGDIVESEWAIRYLQMCASSNSRQHRLRRTREHLPVRVRP